MLKSTHRPAHVVAENPLPPGWTEHKAPSGHSYYYNAETKQSTYTRPQPYFPPVVQAPSYPPNFTPAQSLPPVHCSSYDRSFSTGANRAPVADFRNHRQFRSPPQDRPRSKHAIPNCEPWLLVKTKLGRRFVHNPATKESFWKYPKDVLAGVVEFDIQERKRKEREERGESEEGLKPQLQILGESREQGLDDEAAVHGPKIVPVAVKPKEKDYDSDIYEEVEVTDDEEDGEDADGQPKRRKFTEYDSEDEVDASAGLEFTEEDMAAQLSAMGETYDLAPEEYGAEDWDEEDGYRGEASMELTADEAALSFTDMLTEHGVDPYKPWDVIIESPEASILADPRYTLLSTMKARRAVFAEWSAARIAELRVAREKAAKVDPRVPYLALLSQYASPKLYWPEFKRKFKKEGSMKDLKLADREREKLYREHIARITKLSRTELERDLKALLKSVTASKTWNRATRLDDLPESVTTDLRFISLAESVRAELVDDFIKRLPRPEDADGEAEAADAAAHAADQKTKQALDDRQHAVQEAQRRQQKELQYGRSRLREEEESLDRAMQVGKTGLRGALADGGLSEASPL